MQVILLSSVSSFKLIVQNAMLARRLLSKDLEPAQILNMSPNELKVLAFALFELLFSVLFFFFLNLSGASYKFCHYIKFVKPGSLTNSGCFGYFLQMCGSQMCPFDVHLGLYRSLAEHRILRGLSLARHLTMELVLGLIIISHNPAQTPA